MKKPIYIILVLIFFYSCNDSRNNKEISEKSFNSNELESEQNKLNLDINSDSILKKWVEHYRESNPSFSLTKFNFEMKNSLNVIEGTVFGNFDKEFDKIYKDFLIYNSDSSKYIDFDSYSWTIDENGEPSFSPDQEVNLVDIKNKTVNRIAFRGPSQWVEDAYWNNNWTIILLENNYEKQPIITIIDLKNGLIRDFKYNETLGFESDYTIKRFKEKGITYK